MGWTKLLQDSGNVDPDIILSLKNDLSRISEITDRFSKIGSKLRLNTLNVINIINDIKLYFDPKLHKNHSIMFINTKIDSYEIDGDRILLMWAFENLIKNAVDSLAQQNGKIIITT